MERPKIKIIVSQFFECDLPEVFSNKDIYLTMQSGNSIADKHFDTDLKDDCGENISDMNPLVNEITCLYWMGKHYEEIGNPQFIGLDHYRRYLKWKDEYLDDNTIVCSSAPMYNTITNQYAICHNIFDYMLFVKTLGNKIDGDMASKLSYWSNTATELYKCNIFIMSKDNFMRLHSFILKELEVVNEILSKSTIQLEKYDSYQKRVFSFIMERMTGFWIWYNENCLGMKVIRSDIEEFPISNKINSIN